MSPRKSVGQFIMIGNHRCLDFINTELVEHSRRVDRLQAFADLVAWLERAEVLSAAQAKQVLRRWDGTPAGARALMEARAFRDVLREMVERLVHGRPVPASALGKINGFLRDRLGHAQLVRARSGVERRAYVQATAPTQLLVPVAESASDLLCDGDTSLILKCRNPGCILYFYDVTKNHARRWCSMSLCGNRMKSTAHYRRHRRAS